MAGLESGIGLQVEIIDLLYRCAKHGNVHDTYLTAFSSQARPALPVGLGM